MKIQYLAVVALSMLMVGIVMVSCQKKEEPISDAVPAMQVVYYSEGVDNDDDFYDDVEQVNSETTRAN